jgi:hypothetical protein
MELEDKATSAIRKMQAFCSVARSDRLTASVRNSCIENQEPILQLVGLDGSDHPSRQGISGFSCWIARVYRKLNGGTAEALARTGNSISIRASNVRASLPATTTR